MKIYYFIGVFIISLFVGCSQNILIREPYVEKQYLNYVPNSFILSEVKKKLSNELTNEIKTKFNLENIKFMVASLEKPNSFNDFPNDLIEDYIINALVQNNVQVVERNDIALVRLVNEGDKSKIDYESLTTNQGIDNPFSYNARLKSYEYEIPVYLEKNELLQISSDTKSSETFQKSVSAINRTAKPLILKQLDRADIILFYRVLECGIRYLNNDETYESITRKALIKLNVRLVLIRDGSVLWSNQVSSTYEDKVHPKSLNFVENSDLYKYYLHNLPNIFKSENIEVSVPSTIIRSISKPGYNR